MFIFGPVIVNDLSTNRESFVQEHMVETVVKLTHFVKFLCRMVMYSEKM